MTFRPEYGPRTLLGQKIHASKYRQPNETFREAMTRVAHTLSDDDDHFRAFRDALLFQRFLPAGRIQAAIGSSKVVTAHNCFVSGTIEDSFVNGVGSIMNRASEAAATMRLGGGIGYDFSTLRPRGAQIKKLGSQSSGPVSFMDIFDAVCRATSSSGHRRGAQMGVMRIDHPDIEEFIRSKHDLSRLTGFNISVAITDEFMHALLAGDSFNLRWGGTIYRTIDPAQLWETIMRSTYDYAEPGVLFIDTINKKNNLWYCETIAATNPCGEQPLPPYGACLLGSFNLVAYLKQSAHGWALDWTKFYGDIPHVVRAMDNIIDKSHYPLHEQEKEAVSKRRMGLGVTGVANAIEALGFHYGTPGFIRNLEIILSGLRDHAYRCSAELAAEKGAFPLFDREQYLAGQFIRTLSEDVQDLIARNGIRNSHLLSIAPTGTISIAADNISSGIEPVFDYSTRRTVIEFAGPQTYSAKDYGYEMLGVYGKTTSQCTIGDHLRVLVAASRYVDSAVSKTCNVPQDIPYDTFKNIYITAWKNGCKGCTTFRIGGKKGAVLVSEPPSSASTGEELSLGEGAGELVFTCSIDPVTGAKECE